MRKVFLIVLILICLFMFVNRIVYSQEACDPANPNYCTECRDESVRDFAKCGEIDYRYNLVKALEGQRGFSYPDYDSTKDKVVFSGDIGKESARFEIWVLEKGKNKRVTWNANKTIGNLNPFWTKDRGIVYLEVDINYKPTKMKYFILNEDGSNKIEIGNEVVKRLYDETHNNKECYPITLTK